MKKIDRIGERYGKLTIIAIGVPTFTESSGRKNNTWLCRCDCGKLATRFNRAMSDGSLCDDCRAVSIAGRPPKPDSERFHKKYKVDEATGCWNWTAGTLDGYGRFRPYLKKTTAAHRASYELHYGPIPDGICVCHRCDNPSCVNPDHLFLGTNAENTADKVAKGRQFYARGSFNGHAKLTEADVIVIRNASGVTQKSLADRFGVTPSIISEILARKIWTHVEDGGLHNGA